MAQRSETSKAVKNFLYWLATTMGFVFEARASRLLESKLDFFVRGAEGGSVDGGLVVTNRPLSNMEPSRRLRYLSDNLLYENCLIALDFKTTGGQISAGERGGLYSYHLNSSPQQQCCFAFIVTNPTAPHLVAVIPHYYLNHQFEEPHSQTDFYSRGMPLYDGDSVQALPSEWSPFVMPMEYLPAAMERLYQFARGLESTFINPYTGVTFVGCPLPRLFKPSLLRPSPDSLVTDDPPIQLIIKAFTSHSKLFEVRRNDIRPLCGDFNVCHKATGVRAIFEHKRGIATVYKDGVISLNSARSNQKTGFRTLFDSLTTWDWLFIELSRPLDQVLVLSRDDLPIEVFQPLSSEGPRFHEWQPDSAFLDLHMFPGPPTRTFVSKMERLLNTYCQQDSFLARQPLARKGWIPVAPKVDEVEIRQLYSAGIDEEQQTPQEDERPQEEDERPQQDTAVTSAYGNGFRWAENLFQADEEYWLRGQCRTKGRGMIYRLGKHPSGPYVFSPCVADNFLELHPSAPVIYLNFAPVKNSDHNLTTDGRRPYTLLHATHGITPSLYILQPFPLKMDSAPHVRYIVPSTSLNTADLRQYNQGLMGASKGKIPRSRKPIIMAGHEQMEAFSTPEDRTLSVLMRFFTDLPRGPAFNDEFVALGEDTLVERSRFVRSVAQVHEEYITMMNGVSFLNYLDY